MKWMALPARAFESFEVTCVRQSLSGGIGTCPVFEVFQDRDGQIWFGLVQEKDDLDAGPHDINRFWFIAKHEDSDKGYYGVVQHIPSKGAWTLYGVAMFGPRVVTMGGRQPLGLMDSNGYGKFIAVFRGV